MSESRSGNILLVFKDDYKLETLRNFFEEEGFGVYTAHDFDDLPALNHVNLKAVLVDVTDGSQSVIHSIAYIRQSPSGLDIPVMISSEGLQTDNIIAGLNAGADDYIISPYSKRELLARLKSVIARRN